MATWTEEDAYLIAERAHEWAMQGAHEEAAILLTGLVAAVPHYPYARRALAAIYLQNDHPAQALATLDASPVLSQDSDARQLRLEALLALGRRQEAEREFALLRPGLDPSQVQRLYWRFENATKEAT